MTHKKRKNENKYLEVRTLIVALVGFLFINNYDASAQTFEWAKSFGASLSEEGRDIIVDTDGNIYLTGTFNGTVDFDPSIATSNLVSNGGNDVYLSKFDPLGNLMWAKSFGGIDSEQCSSIEIDNSGNLFLTGRFQGTVDFDPNAGVYNLSSNGNFDVFILKLDPLGNFIWARSFGDTGSDGGFDIAIDAIGNIISTGSFNGTIDFDPGLANFNLTSLGASDVFILKLDSNGDFIWAKSIGGTNLDVGNAIAVNDLGELYVAGDFQETVDFNPGIGVNTLTATVGRDAFLLKLDALGDFQWANSYGGASNEYGNDVGIDAYGNILLLGRFSSTMDFDPSATVYNLASNGGADAFITQLDEFGNFIWVKNLGGIDNEVPYRFSLDNFGNIYTTGDFQGIADFDPSGTDFNLSSNGTRDIFISKLDVLGNFVWAQSVGGASHDTGYAIDADNFGNVYTTGRFLATVDFDPGAGITNLTSNGSYDCFIQKLSQCLSTSGTDVQTACDSYTWIDGNTYTSSNNSATFTLTNAANCDSIVTLDLTINNSTTGTDVQTACDSYTWIDGNTYTASNSSATFTLTNAANCDSVVTLDLTINNSTTGTDVQTACDSYTWIDGNTYTASNNSATFTLTNAANCDSVVTLDLTINNSTTGTDVQTACDSYTWIDGNTYTSSNNSATFTLTNAANCDSIVTLDLTINNSTTGTDVQTACDSYTWINGNTYTASNNSATFILTNASNCDSIVTLDLTINNSTTGTDVQTACDSYTWIDGNTYTASNNSATFTLTNAANCDSVVTLDLTINNSTTGTDVRTACDSYTWIDGNTYTSSNNTATFILTNASNCDSIVTLDLTINNSTTGTDVQTACDSYTWIDGNTYTASNNSATFTLSNAANCDSIVTLDLTITTSTTGTDVQTACDSYTWIDGNTYTSSNNTATITLTNAANCDSVITLNLTINSTPSNSVTQVAEILTADQSGASYQWIDCNNGNNPVGGATAQSYTATSNGSYAVIVTQNGCSDSSDCFVIGNIGLNEVVNSSILLYPNPTNGSVTIETQFEIQSVTLIDNMGKLVATTFDASNNILICDKADAGSYTILINHSEGLTYHPIIIK